ncbi:MAG: metal-sensing transcriptional repressor [Clostridia bacterium]|nr:metal-sensing transcriptional repressor [Clostridia bacterium]
MTQNNYSKAVINRLSRTAGHVNGIKRMVEDGRDYGDILIQLSAVRAEVVNLSKIILADHIDECMNSAIEGENLEALDKLKNAIKHFI